MGVSRYSIEKRARKRWKVKEKKTSLSGQIDASVVDSYKKPMFFSEFHYAPP